ncbi:MAG: hypothetical protein JW966_00385 [Anaerolineae bacterium]|nr:hypothetical protein [Anaerolineae bacterium]
MVFFRGLTIERLLVAILFLLLFAMAVRVPTDTDTWWHIRSGEYIIDNGKVPTTDPFSHTRLGEDWIDHSWGSQVVIYEFYHLFGGEGQPGDSGNIGLAVYMAGLATLGMAFVYLMCEGTAYARAFVVVIGAAAAAVFWSPRPQMFSFMLGALVLYLLHLYKREHLDRLWLIPPVMLLWANLHGGFAIGFILLFGSIAGEALGNIFNGDDPRVVSWARLRRMVVVTLVSIPLIAINPYGVQMLGYPFRTVGIGVLQDYIQEWGSPDFHQRQTWPFALMLLGLVALAGLSSRRIDWTDLTLASGTACMALMAGRNITLFAVVSAPILSRHLNVWLADHGWQIHPVRRVRGRKLVLNWVLLALVALGALAKVAVVLSEETVRKAQEQMLPVEVAQFLDESPPEGKMFNSYNWGGYLMFAAPDVPVYVDGRTDLYDDDFLRDYLDITFIRDDWNVMLDDQVIGFVVIEADSILATMLRTMPDTWQERQFDDERSSLFIRVAGERSTNEVPE